MTSQHKEAVLKIVLRIFSKKLNYIGHLPFCKYICIHIDCKSIKFKFKYNKHLILLYWVYLEYNQYVPQLK